MINPQPVHTPRSPYSEGSTTGAPTTIVTPLPVPLTPEAGAPTPKPTPRRLRWKPVVGIGILTLLVAMGGYGYHLFQTFASNSLMSNQGQSSAILKYDPDKDTLDPTAFTKVGDGRFTMVLVGVGGENHPGGNLTDSIQILSLDPINKKASFTSLPRDLYVNVNGYGRTKLNGVYTIGEKRGKGQGAQVLKETIGNILGVTVSNFTMIDFTGLKKIVDTLGGIEVNVPKALDDPFYPADDMIHYSPFSISAGLHTLDGKTALKYARSRETTSDFDRAARQQIIIEAIKKKALSLGILGNPLKVTQLTNDLSKHLTTDLTTDEVKRLLDIYRSLAKTDTAVLDTSTSLGLLTSVNDPNAGYIAYPVDGFDKYEPIQQWFEVNNPDPLLLREAPTITVYGTSKTTEKQLTAFIKRLNDYGFIATAGTNPEPNKAPTLRIMSRAPQDNPISTNYLSNLIRKPVEKGKVSSSVSTDFEIIYVPLSTTNALKGTSTPSASPKISPSPSPSAKP